MKKTLTLTAMIAAMSMSAFAAQTTQEHVNEAFVAQAKVNAPQMAAQKAPQAAQATAAKTPQMAATKAPQATTPKVAPQAAATQAPKATAPQAQMPNQKRVQTVPVVEGVEETVDQKDAQKEDVVKADAGKGQLVAANKTAKAPATKAPVATKTAKATK